MAVCIGNDRNHLGSLMDQIKQAWEDLQSGTKSTTEDELLAVLKISSSRLLEVLSDEEEGCKDFLDQHSNTLPLLFDMLKHTVTTDHETTLNILNSFIRLLSVAGKATDILLGVGAIRTITETIVTCANIYIGHAHYIDMAGELFLPLYTLLLKLAMKEKRFSMISRMTGGVEMSVNILQTYASHVKIAGLVVQVMKCYSTSAVNCGLMVKAGVVALNMKMIQERGGQKTGQLLLKHLLELLASVCKTKCGARKAVNIGAISTLLDMYKKTYHDDLRNRNTKIRRHLLAVIKACVVFSFGCKSFLAANGYRTLYFFGLEALSSKEMVGSLCLIIFILRKCTKNNRLPLPTLSSAYTFRIPTSSSNDDIQEPNAVDEYDDKSDDSDVIEDDDFDDGCLDDDVVPVKNTDEEIHVKTSSSQTNLDHYKEFLGELFCCHDVDNHSSDDIDDDKVNGKRDNSADVIRIPTAYDVTHIEDDDTNIDDSDLTYYAEKDDENPSEMITSLDARKSRGMRRALSDTNLVFFENFPKLSVRNDYSDSKKENRYREHYKKTPFTPRKESVMKYTYVCDFVVGNKQVDCHEKLKKKKLMNASFQPYRTADSEQHTIHQPDTSSYKSFTTTWCPSNLYSHDNDEVNYENDYDYDNVNESDGDVFNSPSTSPDVRSVCPFVSTPVPNHFGHTNHVTYKMSHDKKPNLCHVMLFQDFSRHVIPERIINRVVYDLDALIFDGTNYDGKVPPSTHTLKKSSSVPRFTPLKRSRYASSSSSLKGNDTQLMPHLEFESRFESGNLRRVIHVRKNEYDLILNADVNTNHHHQWFYFQVRNMEGPATQYRFNIINCEKPNSQFNTGMQPVFYSVKKAEQSDNPGWERIGSDICYYKNYYVRGGGGGGKTKGKTYYTATFTITFPYANDTCFLSYHYPYTVTMLKLELEKLESSLSRPQIYYTNQILCRTLGDNDVHLITITSGVSATSSQSDVISRPYVVLTCRVHPGESNSSWIMRGVLDFLTSSSEHAHQLRSMFIFKIVPMLNPDGVVNGSHRCSLSGQDLNRTWKCPDEVLHPSIFHVKSLIEYMIRVKKRPLVFVDFHGHSRKKNVFLYGCTTSNKVKPTTDESNTIDSDNPNTFNNELYSGSDAVKLLPRIMADTAPCFSLNNCKFTMEKSKESTARIVGFRELGITHSFTMESTYNGMDRGAYRGTQVGTRELEEMGWCFCLSLLKFGQSAGVRRYDEPITS